MAYSLVNSAGGNTGSASVTSYTLTYTPGNVGNVFFVVIGYDASAATAISSIKNQASTTVSYTEIGTGYYNGSGYAQHVVVLFGVPVGTTSITVTLAASVGGGIGVYLQEYSGLAGTIDQSIVANVTSSSTSADNVSSGNVTPTGVAAAGGGILWSWAGSYSAFESCTAGTGFGHYATVTEIIQGAVEDKRITTNSAVAATWTPPASSHVYEVVAVVIDESGAVAPRAFDDDFGLFFDGSEDYAAAADQADLALTSYDSAPVSNNNPAPVYECDETNVAFHDLYEEPEIWTFEWSGPIQPNAPPPLWEDTWDFFEEIEDCDLTDDGANVQNNNVAAISSLPTDDAWPHDDDVEDLWDWLSDAQSSDYNTNQLVEDAWPHDDEVEDYDLTDDGSNVQNNNVYGNQIFCPEDAWDWLDETPEELPDDDGSNVQIPNQPPIAAEDAWDWIDEVEDTDLTDDGANAGSANQPPLPAEDAWPHDDEAEDTDLTDDGSNVQSAAYVALPLVEDAWDWLDEVDDDAALGIEPAAIPDNNPGIVIEDAWPHDDEVEDTDLTDDGSNVSNNNIFGNPLLCLEDAWPHDDEVPEELPDDDGFNVRNNNVYPPLVEDAWDWLDEVDDDHALGTEPMAIPDYNTARVVDDEWDWLDEVPEELSDDDGSNVNNTPFYPPPIPEDAWPHDDWVEDTEWMQGTDDVLAPSYYSPPPEDAWPHDDYAEDEYDGTFDLMPVNYVPPSTVLCVEDAWDWNRQDDDDTDFELYYEYTLLNFAYAGYRAGATRLVLTQPRTILRVSQPNTKLAFSAPYTKLRITQPKTSLVLTIPKSILKGAI